ncbi:hypothetical protein D3C85_1812570 [compost metagenome]
MAPDLRWERTGQSILGLVRHSRALLDLPSELHRIYDYFVVHMAVRIRDGHLSGGLKASACGFIRSGASGWRE